MRDFLTVVATVLVVGLCGACSHCDRDGCDAMNGPAANDGTSAIAGALAGASDVVENGCATCGFTSAKLSIWKTQARVTDSASADAVAGAKTADFAFLGNEHYRQPLDAGFYLVCAIDSCVSVEVVSAQVTTVNVMQVYGPTSFYVLEPGATGIQRVTGVQLSR